MNKVSLSSNLVCIEISRPPILFDSSDQKLGTILENKCIENQSYENMSLIKVGFPFSNFFHKKRDLSDFWHRKMTLKIKVALSLTLKIKKNEKPRILFHTQIWIWGQTCSFLNSVKLSWKSQVTLTFLSLSTFFKD